jgi:hypothetical protein
MVRPGSSVHLRTRRTPLFDIAGPSRVNVRSLHVERAFSTIAVSLRCPAMVICATPGRPKHRSSDLAPRLAQCRSPNDPRHGLVVASVRRPGRPGSVAIDVTRCQQARTSTPNKRRAALASSKNPCTKREGVSRAPSDSGCMLHAGWAVTLTDRIDTEKEGAKNTLPER